MSKYNSSFLALALAALSVPAMRADSLWPASSSGAHAGIFADHKAQAIGDILTIVVNETAVAQSTQSKTATRDSTINDSVAQFLYPPAVSGLGTHAGALPSTQISGKAAYDGGGSINNSQTLTATAAVIVTDVLPNGNLVIEGRRVVTFSGETQYVALHGLIRAYDINPDNTVLSQNIANARVEFSSSGQLTDAQKRGWFSKLYEVLRPF
ncbi:MAG TPA: flagellar basal body L-ring protein FlgH [Opitutaceae bacterium]|nr:flagellar basal body L-ring protein FlgH [Opitutaceae bacterium]